MMTWIKLKFAIVLGTVILIVGGTVTVAFTGTNETDVAFPGYFSIAKHETTVIGLVNLDDFKMAMLECQDWFPKGNRYITGSYFIEEGQSFEDKDVKDAPVKIEIVRVHSTNGTVEARENGTDMVYQLKTQGETNDVLKAASLRFSDMPLDDVLDLYSEFSGRTLLIHPAVDRQTPVVVATNPRNKAEAIQSLERVLREKGLAVIPDGNKFEMIVPNELVTNANPHSAGLPVSPADETVPTGTIDFENVDFEAVRDIYAKLIGRQILQDENLPDIRVAFHNRGPLTKSEVLYAFDVLFSWHGVKIVKLDEKTSKVVWTKTVWSNPRKPSPSPARQQTAPASTERHQPVPALPNFKQ